jgi:drug/metabolite transporter (DMT)-like permease
MRCVLMSAPILPPSPPLWAAYGSLALSMALVGSYVALSKPLVAAMPVFVLAWLRFGVGGVAMWSWLRKPAHELPLSHRTRGLLFLESFLGNFLFTLCMLWGMSLTTATSAGVITASIPAVVALLGALFLKERLAPRDWGAMVLAAVGIGLLAWTKTPSGHLPTASPPSVTWHGWPTHWVGNLLVFAAVVCEAAYVVIGKRLTQNVSPKRIAAIINLWGLALMTPLGAWTAWTFDFKGVSTTVWWLFLFYALAASVWTVWLWMYGQRTVKASQAGVFTVMLPISATTVGVVFMGEHLGGMQVAALGLALVGLLVATWPRSATPSRI